MALALEHLRTPEALDSMSLRVHIIEIVLHCLYSNLQITLQCLEQASFTVPFFTYWFNNLDDFLRYVFSLCLVSSIFGLLTFRPKYIVEFKTRKYVYYPYVLY